MDVEKEIDQLTAETLAFTAVIAQVLWQIGRTSPKMHSAISRGFDNAAGLVEQLTIAFGRSASPDRSVQALRIIEDLRTATLGDHDEPKHGV